MIADESTQPGLSDDAALCAAQDAELERLRKREAQIMELIGCTAADKLVHDLRNILNELQLLRMLYQSERQS